VNFVLGNFSDRKSYDKAAGYMKYSIGCTGRTMCVRAGLVLPVLFNKRPKF